MRDRLILGLLYAVLWVSFGAFACSMGYFICKASLALWRP
jgi:hypothetical protein